MADRAAFPTTKPNILHSGNNVHNFLAGGTIVAGQVVGFIDAGVSWSVTAMVAASATDCPIGVALNGASAGGYVAVAGIGCICYVSQDSDGTDIDAGAYLIDDANAIGGCVTEAGAGAATQNLVGVLLEDSDASELTMERMVVLCGLTYVLHA